MQPRDIIATIDCRERHNIVDGAIVPHKHLGHSIVRILKHIPK